MRSPLDALVTEKALHFISVRRNADLTEMLANDPDYANVMLLKNVCAKVSVQLSDQIDEVCNLLDISKRRFLEAAFLEAVSRAHAIIEAEGVWESIEEDASAVKVEAVEGGEAA